MPKKSYTIGENVKEFKIESTVKWGTKQFAIVDEHGHVYDYKRKYNQAEKVVEQLQNELKTKKGRGVD